MVTESFRDLADVFAGVYDGVKDWEGISSSSGSAEEGC